MKKKYIKNLSLIISIIFITVLISVFTTRNLPNKIYFSGESCSIDTFNKLTPLNSLEYKEDSIDVKFMGLFNIKRMELQKVNEIKLKPGGYSVGIKIDSDGVLVVGFSDVIKENIKSTSPAKDSGIEVGDLILEINDKKVNKTKDVLKIVEESESSKMKIEILRGNEKLTRKVSSINENGKNKIGLWVRDSTAGVGTMTFSHDNTGVFGALGHPITDVDTDRLFKVKEGNIYDSAIISLRKGEEGNPGELKGIFTDENNPLGVIKRNTECGIFGYTKENNEMRNESELLPVGFRNEIKAGKAQIITTIDEEGPKKYDIEIIKKLEQNKPDSKSMIIKVVDKDLLNSTGGIIQGMSGSPIIQDGKIIGAVTHVLINKPDVGYGIYIEWMLQDAGILR